MAVKKYSGAVCQSTKVYSALVGAVCDSKKQYKYSADGITISTGEILAGVPTSVVMDNGNVTEFKVKTKNGNTVHMSIISGMLSALHMTKGVQA